MSSTEDQPAAGYYPGFFSNDNAEAGPITLVSHPDPDIAVISLGKPGTLYLRSAGLARELLKAAAEALAILDPPAALAGEMDAEITRQRQPADEPDPAVVCSLCGAADVPTVLGDDGEPRCYNHPKCAKRVAARDAEASQVAL